MPLEDILSSLRNELQQRDDRILQLEDQAVQNAIDLQAAQNAAADASAAAVNSSTEQINALTAQLQSKVQELADLNARIDAAQLQ